MAYRSLTPTVFYLEGWLLLATGTLMVVKPEIALEAQGFDWAAQPLSVGCLAQFGVMCVLMGYVGVVAEIQRAVVQACLLGDFLWIVVFVRMVREHGDITTFGSQFSIWITVFLAATRILYLLTTTDEPKKKKTR